MRRPLYGFFIVEDIDLIGSESQTKQILFE